MFLALSLTILMAEHTKNINNSTSVVTMQLLSCRYRLEVWAAPRRRWLMISVARQRAKTTNKIIIIMGKFPNLMTGRCRHSSVFMQFDDRSRQSIAEGTSR